MSVWTGPSCARGCWTPQKQFASEAVGVEKQMWDLCKSSYSARFFPSPVLFSFLMFNLGTSTQAVQPLINVIWVGLHTDHGTRKEESSLPSWMTNTPSFLHELTSDRNIPLSTFLFYLSFRLVQGSSTPASTPQLGVEHIHLRLKASLKPSEVCWPQTRCMWKSDMRGVRVRGKWRCKMWFLMDKRHQRQHFSAARQ